MKVSEKLKFARKEEGNRGKETGKGKRRERNKERGWMEGTKKGEKATGLEWGGIIGKKEKMC